jgi:tRNA(Ile)-lysidine synthase
MTDALKCAVSRSGTIGQKETVLAAVSGGVDSMVLLHVLVSLGIRVHAAHFNHGIRGEQADEDERFVQHMCRAWDVPCISGRADVPAFARARGISLETAAREARYAFLETARAQAGADKIATAHHMDDQAETVLLHLLRGAALGGLCGMKRVNGRIVRPLLDVSRADILAYAHENKIEYRTDETNLQADYTRNKIRLELMPYLAHEFNGAISLSLCRMAELLREDETLLERMAAEAFETALASDGGLDIASLKTLERPVLARVIRNYAGCVDIEKKHVDAVIAIMSAQTGARIDLTNGRQARVSYGKLYIASMPEPLESYCVKAVLPGYTQAPGGMLITEHAQRPSALDTGSKYIVYADAETLGAELDLRTRLDGDVFKPLGAGTKKLKEYFIDKKIARDARACPLLARGNRILWVIGHEIADEIKLTDRTTRVMRLEYIQ